MIVYLLPRAPFAQAAPRSDTLFGAICWAIRWLYDEEILVKLLQEFDEGKPPFVVSSLFPFVENTSTAHDSKILFLPRPLLRQNFSGLVKGQDEYRIFKHFRKAVWMSQSVFEQIASGALTEAQILTDLLSGKNSNFRLHANAIMSVDEFAITRVLSGLAVTGEIARNAINRLSMATDGKLFYQPITAARVNAASNVHTGFYFVLRVTDPATKEILSGALRFLADKGFGGNFSVGQGHCDVEIQDTEDIIGNQQGQRLMTLSLWHPNAQDQQHLEAQTSRTFARLERRKGFIESAYTSEVKQVWKPTLFMLGEGSTFPRDGEREVYGSMFTDEATRVSLNFKPRINGVALTVGLAA